MIPLLVIPKFKGFRNTLRKDMEHGSQAARIVLVTALSVLIMYSIFKTLTAVLEKISAAKEIAFLPPGFMLGLLLLLLLFMLLFSNAVTALGTLFLAQDLELVMAAPIRLWDFFWSKLIEVSLSSSWMAGVFLLPVILAFGTFYHAGLAFYLCTLLLLIPYFIIPAAIAIICVTVFARLVPANQTRDVFLIIAIAMIVVVFMVIRTLLPQSGSVQNYGDILKMFALLSIPNTLWAPSYWLGQALDRILIGQINSAMPYAVILLAFSVTCSALAYATVRLLHSAAFAKTATLGRTVRFRHRRFNSILYKHSLFVTPIINRLFSSAFRAVIRKESKIFIRDMGQALHLLLLLGLCIIYLYNFRVLRAVGNLPPSTEVWWEGLLVVANIVMGAFVITAVSARFVFPSVSLEGRSFWLLQSSPMEFRDILRAKFWCWFIPVATISSVILSSGALAIDAAPRIVLINAACSWIICYGLVGLAIGLGAFFANFHWEHSSQLATSFGSLIYMLVSSVLIGLNMLPTGLLIFLRSLRILGYEFSDLEWYGCVITTSTLIVYLNYYATRWAMNLGEKALKEIAAR